MLHFLNAFPFSKHVADCHIFILLHYTLNSRQPWIGRGAYGCVTDVRCRCRGRHQLLDGRNGFHKYTCGAGLLINSTEFGVSVQHRTCAVNEIEVTGWFARCQRTIEEYFTSI